MKVEVLKAPDLTVTSSIKIFLAGGITSCPNWQDVITDMFKDSDQINHDILLINPRRDNFDTADKSMELEQICWEYNALDQSDIILFWFTPETLCPITLYELGMWANSRTTKVVIGVHPDYKRKSDVEIQTSLARGLNTVSTLDELVNECIKIINNFQI